MNDTSNIKLIAYWILTIVLIGIGMTFVAKKDATAVCKKVEIYIPGSNFFIQKDELEEIMLKGYPVVGKAMQKIDLQTLEKRLLANPYIKKASVYADLDGILHVDIEQRDPILRVLNNQQQDFYIDSFGYKMPVSFNYTAKVLVANGNIDETFTYKTDTLRTKVLKDLFKMAKFINQDSFWIAQIEQMYVQANGDIEMVPRVGTQRIIMGTADSMEVKFRNLLQFYKQKMPIVGWDQYKTINLKFAKQIVCDKANYVGQLQSKDSTAVAIIEQSIISQTQNNN